MFAPQKVELELHRKRTLFTTSYLVLIQIELQRWTDTLYVSDCYNRLYVAVVYVGGFYVYTVCMKPVDPGSSVGTS